MIGRRLAARGYVAVGMSHAVYRSLLWWSWPNADAVYPGYLTLIDHSVTGRHVVEGSSPEGGVPPIHRRAARFGAVFVVLAVGLAAWSIWLGFALPRRADARHWDLAWSGFDIGLAIVLGLAAAAMFRRSAWLLTAVGASAALLACDAWFDVVTATPSARRLAVTEAVLIELPLAALCLWIAFRTERAIADVADLRAFGRRFRGHPSDEPGGSGQAPP